MIAAQPPRKRRRWALPVIALLAATAVAAVILDWNRRSAPSIAAPAPLLLADPAAVYDPVAAGEPLPDGYRRLLDRDQIEPVYTPSFTTADAVDWPGDSLVLGVAGGESAKAYPITHLNAREMVLDTIDGTPILVSW